MREYIPCVQDAITDSYAPVRVGVQDIARPLVSHRHVRLGFRRPPEVKIFNIGRYRLDEAPEFVSHGSRNLSGVQPCRPVRLGLPTPNR